MLKFVMNSFGLAGINILRIVIGLVSVVARFFTYAWIFMGSVVIIGNLITHSVYNQYLETIGFLILILVLYYILKFILIKCDERLSIIEMKLK